ncbi:MAG TPA: hypothetical protein VJ890_26500 [Vineibacter sp.]|nr:hypothetical protein [Vineibacter sp.]
MAEYPALASALKQELQAAFKSGSSLDELTKGVSAGKPDVAALKFTALHLAWATRLEHTRRVEKIVVWKNVIDWNGVFEAHVHFQSDKRAEQGIYVNFSPSSYSTVVKVLPGNLRKDGSFSSELYDWSIQSNPSSSVDGKFNTNGKSTFELRPNPLRPFRGREIDWQDDSTEVET